MNHTVQTHLYLETVEKQVIDSFKFRLFYYQISSAFSSEFAIFSTQAPRSRGVWGAIFEMKMQ